MIAQFQGEYRWLSNFWPVEVTFQGAKYPSVEHAYMSAKSDETVKIRGELVNWKVYCQRKEVAAGTIKKESRKIDVLACWDDIKLSVMEECLRSKFSNPQMRELLLSTGDKHLQEGNWWSDTFWGVNLKTNKGENNLGKLLMKIRFQIKEDVRKSQSAKV